MAETAATSPGAGVAWLTAIRPRTLTIAVTPVIVGLALAGAEGAPTLPAIALMTMFCAALIQIGTNLHNDAADFARGNDGAERLGPLRVTAAGWLPATAVRRAALAAFVLAFILGIALARHGGWPIVAIGLASLAAAAGYSGGRRPISHSAQGELYVWTFFGVLAVSGTYWLQAAHLSWTAVLAGAALGCPAAAVLLINNIRDLDGDCRAGRRTLAAVLGEPAARRACSLLMLAPFVLLPPIALRHPGALLALLALPLMLPLATRLRRGEAGRALNALLAGTARAELACGLLFAAGVRF